MIRDPFYAALVYALLVIAFLFAVPRIPQGRDAYDPGPGDGPDYPIWDRHSGWHIAGCFVACLFALWLGAAWPWALGLTVAGGLAYEAVNGTLSHRGSWYDVGWDTAGAVLAVGLFGGALQAQDTTWHGAEPEPGLHWTVIAMWVVLAAAGLGAIYLIRRAAAKRERERQAVRERDDRPAE